MAVMHEAELHDLSDDSDYAASIEQGSTSNARNDAESPSEVNEQSVGEIVYLKDHVTIHPTQYAYERISGRLQLMKIKSSLYLSWIPYKRRPNSPVARSSSAAKMLEKDRNLYTIRSLPLTDVRSVRRYTPALGWQYIIVVLNSGLAYPPLYFYNGGVREFLGTLKQHVSLARSQDDANVFLVNNLQDPLQKTLSSLHLPMVSVGAGPSTFHSVNPVPGVDAFDGTITSDSTLTSSANSRRTERPRFKNHDPASDLQFQVLEKFSLITKFARDTTSTLFRDNPLLDGSSGYERAQSFRPVEKPHSPKPPPVDAVADEQDESLVPQTVLVPSDPVEVDKLSLIWGKPRQGPLGPKEWATFLDSEGRIVDSKALKRRIFYGGVESGLRKEIWKFLLGYHEFDSTDAERDYLMSLKKEEYAALKGQWQSISANQARKFTKFRERKSLIDKDVVRTDRSVPFYEGDDNPNVTRLRDILLTYSFYNFDLGYCQGMSDLLSPLLVIMEDESESFWCFAALMERLGPNFNRDQNGMHSQLLALSKLVELLDGPLHNYLKQADCLNYFFCFRWILIQFKREFDYEEIMRLWEVLWTHYLSEHFHLYMCVAVLKRYRKKIIEEQMDFDTLLKFINELSGKINLEGCLRDAEALCLCAGESGAACIAPGTPPSLPIENDMDSSYAFDDVIG